MKKIFYFFYNAFIWRWNSFIGYPIYTKIFGFYVFIQRKKALKIYDAIIRKENVDSIIAKFGRGILSKEIKSVLNKLNKLGYINSFEPLKKDFKISIVMAHYNHQNYITEALNSFINQTERPDEVIIIDDLSPDFELLEQKVLPFIDKIPIRLIKAPHKMYCGPAKQYGASLAIGDIIIFHDADDVIHPQRVEITRWFYNKYPNATTLSVDLVPFYNKFKGFSKENIDIESLESKIIKPDAFVSRHRYVFEHQLFFKRKKFGVARLGCFGGYSSNGCVGSSGVVACRKEVLKYHSFSTQAELKVAFTDWDDYELCTMILLSSRETYGIDEVLYAYRQDASTYILHWQEN